jgi:hypothetical protein
MAGLFLGGCTSVPNQDELLSEPVIYTSRDKTADFKSYSTYYISDTMFLADGASKDSTITNADVTQVVQTIRQNMNANGYTFANMSSHPDLGLQATLIRNQTETYVYGGYWWYYGWYGWYYPPYYPYAVTVPTNQGTIVIDIIDLKNAPTTKQMLITWTAVLSGYLNGNKDVNVAKANDAVNQAFVQSPYLKH